MWLDDHMNAGGPRGQTTEPVTTSRRVTAERNRPSSPNETPRAKTASAAVKTAKALATDEITSPARRQPLAATTTKAKQRSPPVRELSSRGVPSRASESDATSSSVELQVPRWMREHHARVVLELTGDDGTDVGSFGNQHEADTDSTGGIDAPDVVVEDITEAEVRGHEPEVGAAGLEMGSAEEPSPLRWVDSQYEAKQETTSKPSRTNITGPRESPMPAGAPRRETPGKVAAEVSGSVKAAATDMRTFDAAHQQTLEGEVCRLRRALEDTRSEAQREADKNRKDMEALVRKLTEEHMQHLARTAQVPFAFVSEVPSSIRPSSFPSESASSRGSGSNGGRGRARGQPGSDERKRQDSTDSLGAHEQSDSVIRGSYKDFYSFSAFLISNANKTFTFLISFFGCK